MYVDALTLAAVADEWRALLMGARIDTIIQPTEHAIALQCYTPGGEGQPGRNSWLYLSAHPQLARAHLTALKPPKIASEPPPFVMLLRKHLEGARIESIAQPRWERVLEIVAGYRKGPGGDERIRFRLIIEIMGRLSNIILVDEQGMILGSLRRVGAEVNRYRTIAANVPYLPPPPQQRLVAGQTLSRLEPTVVTAAQLSMSAAAEEEEKEAEASTEQASRRKSGAKQTKLWQLLTRHLLGFSPLLAKEAIFRTTGDAETVLAITEEIWEELAWNVRSLAALYDTHAWQPQLVERVEQGEGKTAPVPIAFAPYVLEQYAAVPGMHLRSLPFMNAVLDEFYARAEWRDAMEDMRAPIRKALQTHLERGRRKAELLQQELAKAEEAAQYRLQAELLLAHQHEVQQGQTSIALPNFYAESDAQGNLPEVTIPLDPRFDAVGNANRLFNRYHKLRRATELVPAQIEQNAVELATIEQLLTDLVLAETPAEVALVKAEVQTAGYMRGTPEARRKAQKNQKAGKKGKSKPTPPGGGVPLHVQSREGFTLLIGKNSRQNEDVTFHQAAPNDLWLHARGVPGAHVIIKAAGREIPRSTIELAASLAAYYSRARGSTSVPVDYTLQRHIRHLKGGGPGMVIYERERTIYVEPRGAE
ncbi:MAG TPA: NFACT RNA binding domain-containing protein [Ktedonobacteraceae bacterium]|nr:NFACT RNA binding domain-containing protein [Ktedonobacteraceae bacterium]